MGRLNGQRPNEGRVNGQTPNSLRLRGQPPDGGGCEGATARL